MAFDVSEEDVEGEDECFALHFTNTKNEDATARKKALYTVVIDSIHLSCLVDSLRLKLI